MPKRDDGARGTGFASAPHRRRNALTGDWVLVSPQRATRPWLGQEEGGGTPRAASYDPACYLCPGNERAGGARNPAYSGTYWFDNDFAALTPEAGEEGLDRCGLLVAEPARGICRVICFSPRHDLHLSQLAPARTLQVVETWATQSEELAGIPWVRHLQLFENRGAMMGASNPHPHCQIWAEDRVPVEPAKELEQQRAHGPCLLCDYLRLELEEATRVVHRNEHFVALVPYWAVWPFELLLLPRRHRGALPELEPEEREALAAILADIVRGYDRLFSTPFPYSMGFHQSPPRESHPEWHLHAHYYPPLLRSASVRKFMVGYEMLAQPQRDLTPETAAERLRAATEEA
jgi:UDPglucose--hexose-1-phosphate uridylyltransferase